MGGRPAPGARRALTAIFFLAGFAIASWAPHIPQVQDDLGLSEGALGVALLGLPVGALLAQPAAGWLAVRRGSRPVLLAALVAFGLALPLPTVAVGQASLAGALVLLGFGAGAVDVSMNVQGSSLEVRLGRPILSSLHAAYSFGALPARPTARWPPAPASIPPRISIVTGALVAVLGVACAPAAAAAGHRRDVGGPRLLAPDGGAGGARSDGGLRGACRGGRAGLERRVHAGLGWRRPRPGGVAFVAFSATWAVTRLLADPSGLASARPRCCAAVALLAAVGFGAGLLLDTPAAAIAGFACLGAGIAAGFPS